MPTDGECAGKDTVGGHSSGIYGVFASQGNIFHGLKAGRRDLFLLTMNDLLVDEQSANQIQHRKGMHVTSTKIVT